MQIEIPLALQDTLAGRVLAALVGEPAQECPITAQIPEKSPEGTRICDVPSELRKLVTLWAEMKANHTSQDQGMVWTWKAAQVSAVHSLITESLRVGGKHGRVYIELCRGWKYAAVPC